MSGYVKLTEWKDQIRKKIINVYGEDGEKLSRLLFFLDEEDTAWEDDERSAERICSPFWRTLRIAYNSGSDTAFKAYADRLIQDTVQCEKDVIFRKIMREIYEGMADPCDETNYEEPEEFKMSLESMSDAKVQLGLGAAILKSWDMMPVQTQQLVLEAVKNIGGRSGGVLAVVEDVGSLLKVKGGTVVLAGLAALTLTYECITSLNQWWKGEITGTRCVKNCLQSLATIGVGVCGSFGGSMLGTLLLGPGVGTVLGGVVGGVVAGMGANSFSDMLLLKIFDIPKSVAVENAYIHLGVSNHDSNDVINTAFRKKALKCHPDKGGKAEDFYLLQMHMATIKLSREGKC